MQENEIQKPQINMYMKEAIKNVPLFLTIITAFLYSWGLSYYQGFLSRFGLIDALFPLSFEQTLLQGAVMMGAWAAIFIFAISILFCIVLYSTLWLFNYINKKDWFTWARSKIKARHGAKPNEHLKDEIQLADKMMFFSYCSLIAFLLWGVSLLVSYRIGFNAAESRLRQYVSGNNRTITIAHKTLGSVEGHVVICSSSHCAFFVGNDVKIYRLDEISSFVSKGKIIQTGSENAATK